MQLMMRPSEIALFESVLRCTDGYVEFGCGASTVLALSLCRSIIAIDSAPDWLERVRQACPPNARTRLRTLHVDIGPTKQLGHPDGTGARSRWATYHTAPWSEPGAADADTYLIDGRFRVACMVQAALHCRPRALLLCHDYEIRAHYQRIAEVLHEVARADTMSVFQKPRRFDRDAAAALLRDFELDPR